MTKNKTGNNKFLKKYNQAQILNMIRVHEEISRSGLSKVTGLSPTAIGGIVSELIEKEYIHEVGTGQSKGGRRPMLLKLRPDSYYSIGVDIAVDYINIVLIDSTGQLKYKEALSMRNPVVFDDVVQKLYELVLQMMEMYKLKQERLLGLGISVPGLIDAQTDKVMLAPNLGWEDVDLKSRIHEMFWGVPIYVENESRASAIYESWIGACQNIKNFVCINIESGIGAGIFAGGKLYKGVCGSAGEIGHITVDENGPKCGCGNYGCLETLASMKSMVEKAKRMVRQGSSTLLNNVEDVEDITIDMLVEAARNHDQIAMNILTESARYLGIAISYIINTLNPSKIVLGKEFVKYSDLVMDQIKGVASRKSLSFPANKVEIVASEIGRGSSAIGAAIIPLKLLFGK
ncbi:MAG: ROK family transcriptional regulator [Clostridia bacterium]|nr:ROK family transcriptional regulator [Clostridia bacterium]